MDLEAREGDRMRKKDFRTLWAVKADIEARKKRIARMRELLQEDARMITDTVQASAYAPTYGLRTVKISGLDISSRAEKRAVLYKLQDDMDAMNQKYIDDFTHAVELIEQIEDADLRAAVHMACLDGEGWEEIADTLGKTGDAWRMRVERWLNEKCK